MSEAQAGPVAIDCCAACGGVWYDREELEHAVAAEKSKKQELWDHLPASPPQREAKAVYRSCPICRQSMLRRRRGPVIVDLCGHHGAFLDAGELEAIAQHVEPPAETTKPVRARPVADPDAFAESSVTHAIVGEVALEVVLAVLLDW
jgi:Zn-finger nucleic acid-binding protein